MLSAYWYDFEKKTLHRELTAADFTACLGRTDGVLWVDILAPTPEDARLLEEVFQFQPLCVEDCLHPQVVPKLEEYRDHVFMVLHALKAPEPNGAHESIQDLALDTVELDLFLGENFLVTMHPEPLGAIAFVRQNLERGSSAITLGAVSLAHELLDAVVDLYMPVLEGIDDRLEALENRLLESAGGANVTREFFALHRAILKLRRLSLKEQEVFYWLSHRSIAIINEREALLFRDIYDHMVRVVELSESYREILAGIQHIHLSLASNRMNDIMRILTIYAAIMLPLTFIASIYGMNFEFMPELHWRYGYFMALGAMALTAVVMLAWFRRKGWL